MSKPPTSWKGYESRIASIFGGTRRGAYVSAGSKGKSDIIKDGFSIECKLLKQPTWQKMLDACRQAENNAESSLDIPIAVVKKNKQGLKDMDTLVIMRLETFRDHFIGDTKCD